MGKGVFAPGVFRPSVFGGGALAGIGAGTGPVGFPLLRLSLTLRSSNRLMLSLRGAGDSDPLGPAFFLEDGIGVIFAENSPAASLMEGVPSGNRFGLSLRSTKQKTLTLRTK